MTASPVPRGGGGSAALRFVLRLVVDHNPFYLLSAVCMMAGCLTLTNSTSYSPIRPSQLLALVLTLNAYEVLLVGLGLFLIVRRGVRRDGLFLLLIEAAFLVDMAFLNAEVYSVRPALGIAVNAVVFALAVVKLVAIFRVLRFPLGDGLLPFVLAQLLVLFAIPGVFAKIALGHDGRMSPWVMYGAWWAAGMLPVLYAVVVGPGSRLGMRAVDPVRNVLTKVLILAPVISLIVHLCTANWVYKLDFYPANVAPLFVGLAFAAGHLATRGPSYRRRVRGQLVLPALAVLMSVNFPDELVYAMTGPDWSPLRLVLLAAALVYADGWFVHRNGAFAYAAGLCMLGFGMGPSVADMDRTASAAAERSQSLADRLTPRTPQQWGVVSVVASFMLLGLGFLVSLLKPVRPIGDDMAAGD